MSIRWSIPCSDSVVAEIVSTTRSDGSFRVPPHGQAAAPGLEEARQSLATTHGITPGPWTWFRQVHGNTVHQVSEPGAFAGVDADGAFTTTLDCPLAINTADCAPVVLVSTRGVAVIHAGWRGAKAGIIEVAGERLLHDGGEPVAALLGPCIGPGSYEFSEADLAELVDQYGDSVASTTTAGRPALDMAALVGAACLSAGWTQPSPSACTSDGNYFSHRVRGDVGRQTTIAWLRAADDTPERSQP